MTRDRTRWSKIVAKRAQEVTQARIDGANMLMRAGLSRDGLTDEDKARLESTKPRQTRIDITEAQHQATLADHARYRWWWPGFRHHEQARFGAREGAALRRKGQKAGWPDVTLHIPPLTVAPSEPYPSDGRDWRAGETARGKFWLSDPVLAALELKAENGRPTDEQLQCLAELEACGYRVTVAWGWEAALAWLDEVAGPEPDVLPEIWKSHE